ncbi:GMC oxidoreductase [Pelagibacterium montanilacus]|uniref:GMC oxidoreductase n=1 Tax=Pelagibacterium montanilacus TaxID=2185280 RepID=UPI000F8DE3E0|nr:GMC family oxidoreductase [Pelagibacterium montanilacus]
MASSPDIVIIGSGIGGATLASGIAPGGASILILEAGGHLSASPANRDQVAIFQRRHFHSSELWYDSTGKGFSPGNYYYVGGNSKFYGAVLARYRAEDFGEIVHREGVSPAWPFPYETLEPWYTRAEQLYAVRGMLGEDPTEPSHSGVYAHPPVPDEPAIARVRARLSELGLHPYSLPLGVDIDAWLAGGQTPWDAHPSSNDGKMDAETAALSKALAHDNVRLETGARVTRLETAPDGKAIAAVHYRQNGEDKVVRPALVVLSAGAVKSAALLLASADNANPDGLANRSGQVGRNFMNHNASAVIATAPWYTNDSVYQKTFGFNDFYLSDGEGGPPLGNVQLLGRVSGPILKSSMPSAPGWLLDQISRHGIDFYAMSEDIPSPESRVTLDGQRIVLHWTRTNWQAHLDLVARLKSVLRRAGFPLVVSQAFDKRTPSHQCGTVRMGSDPATSPLDIWCRAHDHPNLFVMDASFLPTSAAVNPSLTIAAQALRVADHIATTERVS